jgi:hypothetical protein
MRSCGQRSSGATGHVVVLPSGWPVSGSAVCGFSGVDCLWSRLMDEIICVPILFAGPDLVWYTSATWALVERRE